MFFLTLENLAEITGKLNIERNKLRIKKMEDNRRHAEVFTCFISNFSPPGIRVVFSLALISLTSSTNGSEVCRMAPNGASRASCPEA